MNVLQKIPTIFLKPRVLKPPAREISRFDRLSMKFLDDFKTKKKTLNL